MRGLVKGRRRLSGERRLSGRANFGFGPKADMCVTKTLSLEKFEFRDKNGSWEINLLCVLFDLSVVIPTLEDKG